MSEAKPLELRVSVDVGYRRHSVAMGLSSGEVLEEFEIEHRPEGFQEFFSRIEKQRKKKNYSVAVAMWGQYGVRGNMLDFILGTHPITTKGTTQLEGGAKRRSGFDV